MERAATSGKTDAAATAAVAQGRSQTRSSSATPTPHGGQYRCAATLSFRAHSHWGRALAAVRETEGKAGNGGEEAGKGEELHVG
eukprot:357723-Chlamydomonas_euryale.AAC.9